MRTSTLIRHWVLLATAACMLIVELNGCSKTEDTPAGIRVEEPQVPVPNFSASPTTGIAPLTVQFTDQSTGTIAIREWIFGDGGTSGELNPSHSYVNPGVYSVSLMAWGPIGRDTLTKRNHITADVGIVADFIGTPTTGVAPLTVQYFDQSLGTVTGRQWVFGDGGTSTEQNPTHIYQVAGTYSVSLTVTGPIGSSTKEKLNYISMPTPVPGDLFPLTVGHKLTYDGYGTSPGGSTIPDPTNSYNTIWTIAANGLPSPLGDLATVIIDSTRGPFGSGGGVDTTMVRNVLVGKEQGTENLRLLISIGPFKRAFGIPVGSMAADTLVWLSVARPGYGVGTDGLQWTAYDRIFFGTGGVQVRLEMFGKIETLETITDSSATMHNAYRARTWRKITAGGSVVQDNATVYTFWLVPNIGPVQMRIVEDTENMGHSRSLRNKNF